MWVQISCCLSECHVHQIQIGIVCSGECRFFMVSWGSEKHHRGAIQLYAIARGQELRFKLGEQVGARFSLGVAWGPRSAVELQLQFLENSK